MAKYLLLLAMILGAASLSAQTSEDYFVVTDSNGGRDSLRTNMSPEERFLNNHFIYKAPLDWPVGARFMVMPNVSKTYLSVFFDKETDAEVSVASIKHSIMEYRGHGISKRGRTQMYFYSYKLQRECYYEVHNMDMATFSAKSDTGIPALAYLADVDTARTLLVGCQMWTKTDSYMVDDVTSTTGYTTVHVDKNTPIKIEKVGVCTREFPVKIVFSDQKGNQYFQFVCMSRTNSGLRDEQLRTNMARNVFQNSFLFNPMNDEEFDRAKARPDALSIMSRQTSWKNRDPNNDSDYRSKSWADMVGGRVTKGMTPDDVILCKGLPNHRSGNRINGTWSYDDGTVITFKKGMVTIVRHK